MTELYGANKTPSFVQYLLSIYYGPVTKLTVGNEPDTAPDFLRLGISRRGDAQQQSLFNYNPQEMRCGVDGVPPIWKGEGLRWVSKARRERRAFQTEAA